jgi:hypothetical protein
VTTEEKLDRLAERVLDLERVMRQGFQVLTELHADTQREMNQGFLKLSNSMSALADVVAQHETRIERLEGK